MNIIYWASPCFVAMLLAELAYTKSHDEHKDIYEWKDMFTSLAMGAGAGVIKASTKFISAFVIFWAVYRIFNKEVDGVDVHILGYESFGFTNAAWYVWLACQLADDFCYYWVHRFNHTVRFMWAAHIVHHSSAKFNFGTGLRNGWVTILYKPLFYSVLPAIGFHPSMCLICLGIESLWQFQLHTQFVPKMGFLEKFMNMHTQHQVHHARNVEYLDKNHGGYLNIFDKMFGTWKELDENIEIEYGVVHEPNSHNPLVVVSHEYKDIWNDVRNAKKLSHAFMYIFGPPGWSPDGSTLTVRQIQRQMKQAA